MPNGSAATGRIAAVRRVEKRCTGRISTVAGSRTAAASVSTSRLATPSGSGLGLPPGRSYTRPPGRHVSCSPNCEGCCASLRQRRTNHTPAAGVVRPVAPTPTILAAYAAPRATGRPKTASDSAAWPASRGPAVQRDRGRSVPRRSGSLGILWHRVRCPGCHRCGEHTPGETYCAPRSTKRVAARSCSPGRPASTALRSRR